MLVFLKIIFISDKEFNGSNNLYNATTDACKTAATITTTTENPKAEAYLDHLLNDGCKEGESGYEFEMPSYYNEQLFKQ